MGTTCHFPCPPRGIKPRTQDCARIRLDPARPTAETPALTPPMPSIELIEINQRAAQGVTRPFRCRGYDGHWYYAKGADAGKKSLVAEWVAGRLGRALGLPIPEFRLAQVEAATIRYSLCPDAKALGAGVVFASRIVPNVSDLVWIEVSAVPQRLRADVLLFDCWIANGDRTLSAKGGNVNLLWNAGDGLLHVIDHNLAFEKDAPSDILQNHVFAEAVAAWTPEYRKEVEARLHQVLDTCWPSVWDELPEEWLENIHDIDREGIREILWRFTEKPAYFWPQS